MTDMNRIEAWETVVDALQERFERGEFEKGEFEIHHNDNARTITVIHRPTNSAMTLTDTTGAHYDAQNRIVMDERELQ
jgi:hypothetical protein